MIRKLRKEEVYRLAEIIVFNNRKYYYPIFKDAEYSFKDFNVIKVGNDYANDASFLDNTYVYDDNGIIKGYIYIKEKEIVKLYVDCFFQHQGIGSKLIKYAIKKFDANNLYVLEKNKFAISFYNNHNFTFDGNKNYEEGSSEYLLHLVRK